MKFKKTLIRLSLLLNDVQKSLFYTKFTKNKEMAKSIFIDDLIDLYFAVEDVLKTINVDKEEIKTRIKELKENGHNIK